MSFSKDDALSFLNPTCSTPIPVSVGEAPNYLLDHSTTAQIVSSSGSFQSDNILSGGGADGGDSDYGFSRPDFRESPLVGSVEYYGRHVFLCYKNPRNWPPRIEAAEFDRLPRLLSAAMAARKGDMKKEIRLTICEGRDGTETSNGDVLIFPDMVRYRRLTHFDVETFVEEVLVKDSQWLPGSPEKLEGFHVFICSHGSRDRRCGVCGPILVARFRQEVESHGVQGKVSVSPCSHIGGHKYAGNVIIFGPGVTGEVNGHWYGYVSPDDVPSLLERHIMMGEIVEPLWRGQMGLSEEDQKNVQMLRGQSDGPNSGRSTEPLLQLQISISVCSSSAKAIDCCQANGKGTSCCENPASTIQKKDASHVVDPGSVVGFTEMKNVKPVTHRNGHKSWDRTSKVCAMPNWIECWEREDTYAAIAVVCAVASVGIAYSLYKQLPR